jgi:hypothetical protein
MKMKTNLSLAMLFVSIMSVISCKKDNEVPPVVKPKAELLTQAAWKLVKDEGKTGNGNWVDYTGSLSTCEKDDQTIYRTNATYEANQGVIKCSPNAPQIISAGTWKFINNESQISSLVNGLSISNTSIENIELLDENTLRTSYSDTSGGVIYGYRYTYGH